MKLPGWQASTSTAMPRKSPALRGAPKMVNPAVQRFVALDNPNDYLRLAQAKRNLTDTVFKGATALATARAKISKADESARRLYANTQHAEEMAEWTKDLTTDKSLYETVENVDGSTSRVYHWEDAVERFNEKSQEVQDRLAQENNFKFSDTKTNLARGFMSTDKQLRSEVQTFVGARRVDRGQNADMETLDNFKEKGNILGIEQLRGEMIRSGRWNASTAFNVTNAAIKTASYSQTIKQIQSANSTEYVSSLMRDLQSGEGMAANMTVSQRQQAISEGNDRLTGIHLGGMRRRYNDKGLPGALDQLNALADGGPAMTGAVDEVSHNKIIGVLNVSMNRLAKIDADRTVGQAAADLNNVYFGGTISQSGARTLTNDMRSKSNRDIVDAGASKVVDAFAGNPGAFYRSPEVDQYLMMGARVNYNAKPFVDVIEADIRGGSVLAAAKVRQIERVFPNAFDGLSSDVGKKIAFIETHQALNLTDDVNVMFSSIENMPQADRDTYDARGTANLKEQDAAESFTASLDRLDITDNGGYFTRDVATPGSHSQVLWKQTYDEMLPYNMGDHMRTSDEATRAVLKSFGNTTAYGDPTLVFKSPEVMYQSEGRAPGAPSEDFNAQREMQFHELNMNLQAGDKAERYSSANTREEYWRELDGEHRWIARSVDTGGIVMTAEGKVRTFTYDPEGNNVENDRIITRDKLGAQHVQFVEKITADLGVDMTTFEDAPANPITGWVADTVTSAVAMNEQRWADLTPEQIDVNNGLYNTTFNILVDAYKVKQGAPDQWMTSMIEQRTHLFLASRGYMHGNIDGEYVRPAGGY